MLDTMLSHTVTQSLYQSISSDWQHHGIITFNEEVKGQERDIYLLWWTGYISDIYPLAGMNGMVGLSCKTVIV